MLLTKTKRNYVNGQPVLWYLPLPSDRCSSCLDQHHYKEFPFFGSSSTVCCLSRCTASDHNGNITVTVWCQSYYACMHVIIINVYVLGNILIQG